MVRTTRIAAAPFGDDRLALVLGGDCTVGIGTMAGVQRAVGPVGLVYFDLHSDLNMPASARDGALDWMGRWIGWGSVTCWRSRGPNQSWWPLRGPTVRRSSRPSGLCCSATTGRSRTRFERGEIERLGIERVPVEEVRDDPEAAAHRALGLLARWADRFAIHLDVDVVDFTDAPLSEHPSRNVGLRLDEMFRALAVLASAPGLVAVTLAELNPYNATADEGLLERFAASFAAAIGGRSRPDKSSASATRVIGQTS